MPWIREQPGPHIVQHTSKHAGVRQNTATVTNRYWTAVDGGLIQQRDPNPNPNPNLNPHPRVPRQEYRVKSPLCPRDIGQLVG